MPSLESREEILRLIDQTPQEQDPVWASPFRAVRFDSSVRTAAEMVAEEARPA